MTPRFFYLTLVLALLCTNPATAAKRTRAEPATYRSNPAAMAAANAMAARLHMRPASVRGVIGKAQRLPAVVNAVTPGQASAARDWALYRSRVMEPLRIQAGVRFWQRNADTLARAERETGVSANVIVGILGVETIYGKHMGGYRTIDALSTLAFDFPAVHPKAAQRAAYFLQELEEFLRLCKTQGLDPLKVRGSYAGALGMAQFMPSSWRQYAVDFDGDGRIDLFGSRADAIGSVANYLAAFHWKPGMPTHYAVQLDPQTLDLPALLQNDIVPSMSPLAMRERGAELDEAGQRHPGLLALIELPNGSAPTQYVAGTDNFYTVTRYNWSSFYAMSVIELGQEVQTAWQRESAAAPAQAKP
ncbi:MAG: lytic murein transglycosylase B [Rhodoferax sp.]|nr:lytic murein transglycosylase B [Rhodoferax sp.]